MSGYENFRPKTVEKEWRPSQREYFAAHIAGGLARFADIYDPGQMADVVWSITDAVLAHPGPHGDGGVR